VSGGKLTARGVSAEIEVGAAELVLAALPGGLVHLLAGLNGRADLMRVLGDAVDVVALDRAGDCARHTAGGADTGGRGAQADVQGDGDGDDDGGR